MDLHKEECYFIAARKHLAIRQDLAREESSRSLVTEPLSRLTLELGPPLGFLLCKIMELILFNRGFGFSTGKSGLTNQGEPGPRGPSPSTEDPPGLPALHRLDQDNSILLPPLSKLPTGLSSPALPCPFPTPPSLPPLSPSQQRSPPCGKWRFYHRWLGKVIKDRVDCHLTSPELDDSRFQDIPRKHKYEPVERYSGGGGAKPTKIKLLLCDYK